MRGIAPEIVVVGAAFDDIGNARVRFEDGENPLVQRRKSRVGLQLALAERILLAGPCQRPFGHDVFKPEMRIVSGRLSHGRDSQRRCREYSPPELRMNGETHFLNPKTWKC